MEKIYNEREKKKKNLFLSRSSVKRIKNFHISLNIVLLHNLGFSKLRQRNKSYKTNPYYKRSDQIQYRYK